MGIDESAVESYLFSIWNTGSIIVRNRGIAVTALIQF
jgi:hypothetical protein